MQSAGLEMLPTSGHKITKQQGSRRDGTLFINIKEESILIVVYFACHCNKYVMHPRKTISSSLAFHCNYINAMNRLLTIRTIISHHYYHDCIG